MSEGKDVRIGVYVCHCGGNISDYVDVKKVVEAIKDEPNVVVAKDVVFACADSSQNEMIEDIKNNDLNRLVVASCSPKLHELTFRGVAERAGLNPYTYYHANIREQSSWAHTDDKVGATIKAVRHTRAAIAYVRLAEPLERIRTPSTRAAIVVGGGIAGMRAAIALADAGIDVHLVEKAPFLGGRTAQLCCIYPYDRGGSEIVRELIKDLLKRSDRIKVYTNAEVAGLDGYVGNFVVTIKIKPRYFKSMCPAVNDAISTCGQEIPDEFNFGLTKRSPIVTPPFDEAYPDIPYLDIEHCNNCETCIGPCKDHVDLNQRPEEVKVKVGALVVTTGFDPYEPGKGEFGYGEHKNVMTLQQLHRVLALNGHSDKLVFNGKEIRNIAFIYCVGSRQKRGSEEESVNEYCSRYCCNAAVYVTVKMLEKYKNLRFYHLYRDIRTYGKNELMYEQASKSGVVFMKYDEDDPPKVLVNGGQLTIRARDLLTPWVNEIELPVDIVVLVTGMIPRRNEQLNRMFKISAGTDGFCLETHPKLKPVETNIAGLFIGGACQGPKDVRETIASALAAASKASTVALREQLELEPFVAYVDPGRCDLTKKCMAECPYEAIEVKEYPDVGKKAWVNEAKCKGCGACVAVCPTEAMQIRGLSNIQIRRMIEAMGRGIKI